MKTKSRIQVLVAAAVALFLLQGIGLRSQQSQVPGPGFKPPALPMPAPNPQAAAAESEAELLKIMQRYMRPPPKVVMPGSEPGLNIESALYTLAKQVLQLRKSNEDLKREIAELKKK